MSGLRWKDYSLTGPESARAVERGLAGAVWYSPPVPQEKMPDLLVRRNGPALRDTLLWFGLLIGFGTAGFLLWGSYWAILPLLAYGVIYGSTSDSRWHEPLHGTAFKTDWLNTALYEMASFMVQRESTPWRWSHMRHHSDTIVVGRDREIAVPRPPQLRVLLGNFVGLKNMRFYFQNVLRHCLGRLDAEERCYIPAEEHAKVCFKARIYLLIYASAIALAACSGSLLPLVYVGLPNLYGAWLMVIYGYTQHAGLAEDVLDHRLNCRTVYMNRVNRYLYWNMNYHLEHHLFPLVPYYNLPALHAAVKEHLPTPYHGLVEAYREIIPTVLRQRKDPTYYVQRKLPSPAVLPQSAAKPAIVACDRPVVDGWVEVAPADALEKQTVFCFDHNGQAFAVYRTADGNYYATEGMCTHENFPLAQGLLIGNQIECPKHNGRFDIRDGSPQRPPACVALKTYPVMVRDGKLLLDLGSGGAAAETAYEFRVVSNENVATFIKELVLEPAAASPALEYQPGEYIQLEIPPYDEIAFTSFRVPAPYASVWTAEHMYDHKAVNPAATRRNYSMASNPHLETLLRFNVRIATPTPGRRCSAGVGSSYVFTLKPGDRVRAFGPFGDFHIKPTQSEMVYVGGGSGMAPLRAHLSHLLETLNTRRKISFWYGARSRQDIFYQTYFERLAAQHENFRFHVALSEPRPEDAWPSHVGLIHDVVKREYLASHPDPTRIEYYLCGPPAMVYAVKKMLQAASVDPARIAFDEF
jgi:MocE subfamily Rieske [2Fe-2S] domain protein